MRYCINWCIVVLIKSCVIAAHGIYDTNDYHTCICFYIWQYSCMVPVDECELHTLVLVLDFVMSVVLTR